MPFKPIKKLICSNMMHKNTLVNYQADSALSNEWGLMSVQKCDSWIKTNLKLNSRHTQSFVSFGKKTAELWIIFAWDWGKSYGTMRQEEVLGQLFCSACGAGGLPRPATLTLPLASRPAQHSILKVSNTASRLFAARPSFFISSRSSSNAIFTRFKTLSKCYGLDCIPLRTLKT